MKAGGTKGATIAATALAGVLALPAAAAAGGSPVNDVVDNLRGTVNRLLPQSGGGTGGAQSPSASGGAQSSPRQASPSGGGYEPPLHGAGQHGQGSVVTLDLSPSSERPLAGDPAGGSGSSEEAVVGRARGEKGDGRGNYHGHITVLALFGNEIVGVDTNEGESAGGPLRPIQSILDEICNGSGGNLCLAVLRADSTTTSNGSTNVFETANVRLLSPDGRGIEAAAATSSGRTAADPDCDRSSGSSTVADANIGGSAFADVAQSSSTADGPCGDAPVEQSSTVIGLGGSGAPVPAPGCANGTPNTLTGIPGLLPIVCNASDRTGGIELTQSQAEPHYGVREALTVFALDFGGTALLKATTAGSESKLVLPRFPGGGTEEDDRPGGGGRGGPGGGGGEDDTPGRGVRSGSGGDGGSVLVGLSDPGAAGDTGAGADGDRDGDGDGGRGDGGGDGEPLASTGLGLALLALTGLLTLAGGIALRREVRPRERGALRSY